MSHDTLYEDKEQSCDIKHEPRWKRVEQQIDNKRLLVYQNCSFLFYIAGKQNMGGKFMHTILLYDKELSPYGFTIKLQLFPF